MTTDNDNSPVPPDVIPDVDTAAAIAAELDDDAGSDERETPNAEAAKYRRRARDAESQRDALAARVETMQRQNVERVAADRLAQPADLFVIGGAELEHLLGEDGDVDADLVNAAVAALLETRPGLGVVATGMPKLPHGARGGVPAGKETWSGLFQG